MHYLIIIKTGKEMVFPSGLRSRTLCVTWKFLIPRLMFSWSCKILIQLNKEKWSTFQKAMMGVLRKIPFFFPALLNFSEFLKVQNMRRRFYEFSRNVPKAVLTRSWSQPLTVFWILTGERTAKLLPFSWNLERQVSWFGSNIAAFFFWGDDFFNLSSSSLSHIRD